MTGPNATAPDAKPAEARTDEADALSVCYVVNAINVYDRRRDEDRPLVCVGCFATVGPWLACAGKRALGTATHTCGWRTQHPDLTREVIEANAEGVFNGIYRTLDDAEKALGFAGKSATES